MSDSDRNVRIPEDLYARIEKHIAGSEFDSVPKFVGYVLREVLAERNDEEYSQEEEEQVKSRLRALGYVE